LALHLGRRLCGLKLAEPARVVELDSAGAGASAVKRYERRLAQARGEKARMKHVLTGLNVE